MKTKIEIKSLVLGVVAGSVAVLLLGAAAHEKLKGEIAPLAFSVLSVSRHGDPVNGKQDTVLRLAPSHLTAKRLKSQEGYEEFCRQQNETRELTVVTKVDSAFEIPKGTVILFEAAGLYQLGGRLNPPNKTTALVPYEIVLEGDKIVFDKAENVSSRIIIRDMGMKKMIAPDLYWGLSVVWDGKEYKRDPKHVGDWNGPWEIIPRTAWSSSFSLSEYQVPAEALTPGRHTIALKDVSAESNTLTLIIERMK